MKQAILAFAALAFPIAASAEPKCDALSIVVVSSGNSLKGPVKVGIVDGEAALEVKEGHELKGPIKVEVCDRHVVVSNPEIDR